MLLQLRALGYGHVLLLTEAESVCYEIRSRLPRQACGW